MTPYDKLINTKQQVNDVILVMKNNINKTLDRDEKIVNIESKTEELNTNSKRFEKLSTKLKNKLICKNIKLILILLFAILFLILVIVLINIKKS